MSINQRIREIIEHKKFRSNRKFAQYIKVNEGTFHNIVSGKEYEPRFEVVEKILKAFPDVSARWLILNEGKIDENIGISSDRETFEKMLKSIDYHSITGQFQTILLELKKIDYLQKDISEIKENVVTISDHLERK